MTTYLALDIGDKRIGLALGNDRARLARPYRVIQRRSKRDDFARIRTVIETESVDHLLIGLPLNMDGSEGPQARRVRNYTRHLLRAIDLPHTFVDERLSSFEADRLLREGQSRRRGPNDDIAAAVFLQAYLDRIGTPSPPSSSPDPASQP
ncbi:MAG: Holliday junction resolvase RuvX [Caldilineae bacterium]|nr:MAG: Holliday junction resolvase RuvX [Caldilineae bacterium]